MTGNTELIKPVKPPIAQGFIETESASAMLLALRRARAKAKITMISGAPGVGKSETIQHFKQNDAPEAIIFQATAAEGGAWSLACALFTILELGTPNVRDLAGARSLIADVIGPNGFLIIDEGQYLVQGNPRGRDNSDCLEWARSMSENGRFGLAFVGDLKLDEIVRDLPQLRRRTRPGITIPNVTTRDTEIYCYAKGLSDKPAIRELTRISKSYGGLGDLAEIFETASNMSDGDTPEADDVFAAVELLGFKKGGRQ